MNKKRLLTAAFISVLLLSAVAGTQFVNLARANPYSQARDSGVRAAPHGTEPPRISIFSPLNYTIHDTDNVSLTFVVRVGESANASGMRIYSVYYRADWLQNDIKINSFELSQAIPEFQNSLSLTGIPAGTHSITVYATETGRYYTDLFHYYRFYLTGSSSVSFVVDTPDNAANSSNEREVPLDALTNLPVITILNPENKTAYRTRDIALTLNVSFGDSITASARSMREVYYKTDWQPNNTWIRWYSGTVFSATINLTEIPEGNHTITINATERRQYDGYNDYSKGLHYKIFEITGSSSVSFTIDTTAPTIFVLSPQNKTYASSDVQLNFATNESGLQITYSLDGQENVTIAGNTTLTDLSDGAHNVTVYATDNAGNTGASETIYFSVEVPEPFPTTMVIAPIASVAVVGVGLFVYFKKRKS